MPASWGTARPPREASGVALQEPAAALSALTHSACARALRGRRDDIADRAERGEILLAYAMTEPASGTDAAEGKTLVTKNEKGLLLDGEKSLVANADRADFFLVWCREAQGKENVSSVFLLARGAPGLAVEANPAPSLFPGLSLGRLRFTAAPVTEENRVGGKGEGMRVAEDLLAAGHIGTIAIADAVAGRALEALAARLRGRKTFGREIVEHLPVAEPLARLHRVRLALRAVGDLIDPASVDPSLWAAAKAEATDRLAEVLSDAIPLGGAEALTQAGPLHDSLLQAQALRLVFGGNGALRFYALVRALPSDLKRRPVPFLRALFARPKFEVAHGSLRPAREAIEEGILLLSGRGRTVRGYYGDNLVPAGLEADRLGRMAGEVLFLAALVRAAEAALAANTPEAEGLVRAALAEVRTGFPRLLRLSRDLYDFDDAATFETARGLM